MIGRVVGNTYRIVGRLGEGGMGTVYRALDEALEREVAVKVVRPDLAREPEIAERFRLEARTLAKVHHPAIATIHSFLQEGEELFLILELVRGRTLSQALRDDGPFPWRRAVGLLAPALDGIEVAHRLGIVHRDLKPDNLMVTEDGRLKVMDFGIARAVGSSHLTRTGLLVGTLRYVAPEQIRGEEVDRRTDIYSLGIVLYEMLTGRVPFEAGNDYAILRAQIEDMPVPPGNHVAGLPAWLDQGVLRALAKDRSDRFPTADEMRSFLLAQGAPIAATAEDDPLDATMQLHEERGRALPRPQAPLTPPPSQETSPILAPVVPSLPTVATGGGAATTRTAAPPPPPPPPAPLAAPAIPASPGPPPVSAPSSYHPVRLDRSGSTAGRLALAALILLIVAAVGASLLFRRTGSEPEASDPAPDSTTLTAPPAEG
ncbi:MAG TPA: serine/threonine-protein kinase, partial [Thermoanaerobaculia bacterium]|nr:serine/threonine-protein kinase [Thermoanaerobaculia bacterium]